VVQTIGVTYETQAEQMRQAVRAIRAILEGDEDVDQEFMLIRFTDFAEFSLNILVYYFTRDVAWDAHLATKERVNLAIMVALEELGLTIALPTSTVRLNSEPRGAVRGGLRSDAAQDDATGIGE
jgi:MscS family membrane protein